MALIATQCPCCAGSDLARSPAVLMPFVANRAFGWTPVEITAEWGMKTLRQGMAYPLCNSMQCQACGLLFLDIRFGEEEMARLYRDYRSEAYALKRETFEPGYMALNAAIEGYTPDTGPAERALTGHVKPKPRVLDWGGDSGDNTPFHRTASSLDIYDLSDEPPVAAARRVSLQEALANRYDLVVLSHVLEHVPDPEAVVRPAMSALDAGAVLYVEIPYEHLIAGAPHARDLASRKRHWHEHVNFYTEEALRALLERCGLEVVAAETRAFDSLVPTMTQVISMVCRRS